ncbi:MAG TPA: ribonuclease III [bacterium]|nr:ribonuclease III [bacterium]
MVYDDGQADATDDTGKVEMETTDALAAIEASLGYSFSDRLLLERALTHSSFAHEALQSGNPAGGNSCGGHYERFEFLGDAVLSLAISDRIMQKYPDADEGELSRIRAGLVCCDRLAELGRTLGLGEGMKLGKGEEATGGKAKPSLLADTYEAVIAAVYLDSGFERAREVIYGHFHDIIESLPAIELLADYKTPLQEKVQARMKITPYYRVIAEQGPDHLKTFEVELIIAGKPLARGSGRSKKEAEQDAARKALLSGELDD